MSLSFLRDAILLNLQKRADELGQKAIDMRPQAVTSVDQYALLQVDTLAEARAYATAARIVDAEYKKLVEPENTITAEEKPKKLGESVY